LFSPLNKSDLLQVLEDEHFDQNKRGIDRRKDPLHSVLFDVAKLIHICYVLGVFEISAVIVEVERLSSVSIALYRQIFDFSLISDGFEHHSVRAWVIKLTSADFSNDEEVAFELFKFAWD
jgi:hypothetical protein